MVPDSHMHPVVIWESVLIVEVADTSARMIFAEEMLQAVRWVVALPPSFQVELTDVFLINKNVPRSRVAVPA